MSHIFIGIQVPGPIGSKLQEWSQHFQHIVPLKQWTYQDDLHITLAFLGDMKKGNIDMLKRTLSAIANNMPSFQLQITGTGTFGNPKTPRVLWAGLQWEDGLFRLQEKVYQACVEAGYELDKRPFKPHITLGKKWEGTAPLDLPLNQADIKDNESLELSWHVKEFVIFEIHPQLKPRYQPIGHFLLQ